MLTLCAVVRDVGGDATAGPEGARIERRSFAMGTRVDVVVEAADRRRALFASEAALDTVAKVESRLSTWRGDSELARLNAAPVGAWVRLSPDTASELGDAIDWADATGGAFDPTVGALVRAWDLRGRGRIPTTLELRTVRRDVGHAALEVEPDRARRLVDGLVVEEGGFGKGAALRAAVQSARRQGARCVRVNLGGQWASAGECPPVSIVIADPHHRGQRVASFDWTGGSVATSGHSERRLATDGGPISHLLDPRTGRPAPDRGSVTVIASDPLATDAVATALAVLGPEAGAAWITGRPGLAAVFAVPDDDGIVALRASRCLKDALRPREGVRVEFFGERCGSPATASRAATCVDDISPGEGAVGSP